ncbi:hypothetical protein LTR37_016641 [Vermiconidia calcicola]|uniref:Uncharacterized protein n=1 Tax=Vermiconidia calcicola TaxID=1690605 RepID=A0ACC3MQ15_9PEZI|nr:hypothetical protein LTR37_016641 [Vermiconidia calcicola]
MSSLTFDAALSQQSASATVNFQHTSYFKSPSVAFPMAPLPPPEAVLSQYPKNPLGVVHFENLGVVVKPSDEHSQVTKAIRRAFPGNEVPVPELYGWKTYEGRNFIYMSQMPGMTLKEAWANLSLTEKQSVTAQIGHIVSALRDIPHPSCYPYIGSISHGRVQDLYFRGDPEASGPFQNVKEFNDHVQLLSVPESLRSDQIEDPYRHLLPDTGNICFTHADLHLDNIMVSSSHPRKITGILDWEQCGWYPEYWEYCKLHLNSPWSHEWRKEGFADSVTERHEAELDAIGEYWHWRRP